MKGLVVERRGRPRWSLLIVRRGVQVKRPPIIMGHSFGGTFTQPGQPRLGRRRRDDRLGATRGRVNPPAQIKSLFPVLKNPANRHRAVGFTKEQFHYAFTNTVSREESDAAYDLLLHPRARHRGGPTA